MKIKAVNYLLRVMLVAAMFAFTTAVAYSDDGADSPFAPGNSSASDQVITTDGDEEAEPFHGPVDDEGRFRYMVRVDEVDLLEEQTQRGVRSPGKRYNDNDPGTVIYREQLSGQLDAYLKMISRELGRELVVTHYFLIRRPGFSIWLYPEEVERVRKLPGVISVGRVQSFHPGTYRAPSFIGADLVWDGSSVPSGVNGVKGEGMVIAVLDTGINPDHPAFQNDASCGHGLAGAADKLISYIDCTKTDHAGLCIGEDPHDFDGHGTHVSNIAAANVTDGLVEPPPDPPGPYTQISGVAPCAHIRSYRVCEDLAPGSPPHYQPIVCDVDKLEAAMLRVLADGDVDVLNYSVHGGYNPWSNLDNDLPLLDAVGEGIFVATIAGNAGLLVDPVGSVGHRAPWVTAVTASTHDGQGTQADVLMGRARRGPAPEPYENLAKPDIAAPGVQIYASSVGGRLEITPLLCWPPCPTYDIRMTKGSHSPTGTEMNDVPVKYFSQDPYLCGRALPEDYFKDAVAIVRSGQCSLNTKIDNASRAGANLLAIVTGSNSPVPRLDTIGQPKIPVYGMDQTSGQELITALENGADLISDFEPKQTYYEYLTGTSMAAPHVAGAAALLKQIHSDWTPSEIKSALMMTSSPDGTKPDQQTPWDFDDVGSGRVDLSQAALAGLVMDENAANYLAANPETGGDVRTLNLPSIRDMDCTPACAFQRTVRNTLDVPTEWAVLTSEITEGVRVEVDPEIFTFDGTVGATQQLEITVRPLTGLLDEVAFAEIVFTETSQLSPDQRVTVSLKGKETEFGGFVFEYSGIPGVSDPYFVLDPRGSGRLQPWAYKPEDVFPDNPGGLSFVENEEYYKPFAPDGIKMGNIDWQGLGTGKIITWDAGGHRYNHAFSGTTIYFGSRELCEILSGAGRIAGVGIRSLSDDVYKLGAITYEQSTRTFRYIERNWRPDIQYSNDGPYDGDSNPDGWQLRYETQHETYAVGFNVMRLRSGVYFSNDATSAVGLLRSSSAMTSDHPWGEVHFSIHTGFSFEYFQIGRYKMIVNQDLGRSCQLGDFTVGVNCDNPSDDYDTSSFAGINRSHQYIFNWGPLYPTEVDHVPWATLVDRITVAIDYKGNTLTKLQTALLHWERSFGEAITTEGDYSGNVTIVCDENNNVISRSDLCSGSNSLEGTISGNQGAHYGFLLDNELVFDLSNYSDVTQISANANGSGTSTSDHCAPNHPWPPQEASSSEQSSYSFEGQGSRIIRSEIVRSNIAFLDLRDEFIVFEEYMHTSDESRVQSSSSGSGSVGGNRITESSYSIHLYKNGLTSLLLDDTVSTTYPLDHQQSHPGMNTGSPVKLANFLPPGSVDNIYYGLPRLGCFNSGSSESFDAFVNINIDTSWSGTEMIDYVRYAKYGPVMAYIVKSKPLWFRPNPAPATVFFQAAGKEYSQIISFPDNSEIEVEALSVL